jgi:hypothetical protein
MALVVDPFWYNDITILWNKNRLTEFFPTQDQTLEEKFNAIVRLSIYCFIILFFNKDDTKYIYLPFGIMLLTYYVYFNRVKENLDPLTVQQGTSNKDTSNKDTSNKDTSNKDTSNKDISFKGAFDNKSQIVKEEKRDRKMYEKSEVPPINCTKPTIDNPFMNVTMKDYFNIDQSTKMIIDRPEACDTNDINIKKEMNSAFNNNLFKDVNDIFGKTNSQRQFYTMPSTTIPNDQNEFAKWLYLNPKTCKEDQDYCNPYEDLRAKRPVVYDSTKNPIKK